jgi:ABC-type enterochelin transport system substrate-binding protein
MMKPLELYDELKQVAEKLDITVSEHNFRTTGISVKSGLCKVRGKFQFIMNKHSSIHKKIELLADCINDFSHENVYVMPAVRDYLISSSTGDDEDDGE